MTSELISLIIPVYNVDKYLRICIDSVINQTYKNIEIILVDDGSTDSSGDICDEYAKKDKRIAVLHKKNGGLSDARNEGLKISKGSFITFIDSDDCVSKNYIELLFNAINKDIDVSVCNYELVSENFYDYNLNNNCTNYDKIILDNIQCIKSIYENKYNGLEFLSWGKLYKKDLFIKNDICFPKGKIHEDTFTTYKLLYYSKSIAFINNKLYYYRQRNGSIMNSKFSIKSLSKLEALQESCDFYLNNSEYELLKYSFNDYLKNTVKLYNKIVCEYSMEDKMTIINDIILNGRIIYNKYKKICNYEFKKRFFYFLFLYSPKFMKRLIIKILKK